MPDLTDPNSPYLILRKADVLFGGPVSAKIMTNKLKRGTPLVIPWKPESYGQPTDRPSDMIDDTEFVLVSLQADMKNEGPGALVSKALYDKLNSFVPGVCKTMGVVLVGPDGSGLDYVAMFPKKRLESKKIDDAKEADLQWGPVAFNEKDAPGELFALTLNSQTFIIVSKRVGEGLAVDTFHDLMLSAFHRTQAEGGAPPSIAAISRILNKEEKPGDIELVQQALQDERESVK